MGRTTVYNSIISDDLIARINPKNKELSEDFLDYLVSVDRSKNTIEAYRHDLQIFFCWNVENNENKYFVDLAKREIAKFQKHALVEWGWSPNRLRRVKATLSSLSNYIENMLDDEIENYRSIVNKIESPVKQAVREKTVMTDEEVDMVLDTLVEQKRYQLACLFALAAFSGSRKSELLRFKVSYFTDNNIMDDAALYRTPEKIVTKGRGSQGKALYKYTLLSFKKYYDLWMNERNAKGLKNEFLFVDENDEILQVSTVSYYSNVITKILGRPFYFHALRHQLCTRLFRLGLPANVVQEYFGWNNVQMTEVYNDTEAVDTFGQFFTSDGIKGAKNKGLSDL